MVALFVCLLLVISFRMGMYYQKNKYRFSYRKPTFFPQPLNYPTTIRPVSFFKNYRRSKVEINEDFYKNPDLIEVKSRGNMIVLAIAIEKTDDEISRWVEVPISKEDAQNLFECKISKEDFLKTLNYDSFVVSDSLSTYRFGIGSNVAYSTWSLNGLA